MKDTLYSKVANFYNLNDENFKEFMAEFYNTINQQHKDIDYIKNHQQEQ